jgi:UDP-N-acetylglucosamine--N-acetylmuramyl-(pentapeptide) pyrophosphoryl-undecaprenol N-acetylglucosamine transferase
LKKNLDLLCEKFFVIHQTGDANYTDIKHENYFSAPFFYEELADLYAAADLIVSRAGAGTVWENGICGKPALLIPLGSRKSRGDQVLNAEIFREAGAAEYLLEPDDQEFTEMVMKLAEDETRLKEMGSQAAALCREDASAFIAEKLVSRSKN